MQKSAFLFFYLESLDFLYFSAVICCVHISGVTKPFVWKTPFTVICSLKKFTGVLSTISGQPGQSAFHPWQSTIATLVAGQKRCLLVEFMPTTMKLKQQITRNYDEHITRKWKKYQKISCLYAFCQLFCVGFWVFSAFESIPAIFIVCILPIVCCSTSTFR